MLSFIYPGQGSQFPGMGHFLYENFKVAKETFEEASDELNLNLKKLCFEGPESELGLTQNTQPALLTTSVATGRVLNQLFNTNLITSSAGHSIGEYAACVIAGVIPFSKAVMAVRVRGESMQKAVPVGEGGMAAILGLEPQQVQFLCDWAVKNSKLGIVEPANYNAPGQIVISGHLKVINWLKENSQNADLLELMPKSSFGESIKKIKMIPLNVSAPFHCSLMKPAEDVMQAVLKSIHFESSIYPIVQNINAQPITEAAQLRQNLVAQVSGAVLWTDCIQKIISMNITQFVEVGAGKVLSGLIKKINPDVSVHNVNSLEEIKNLEKFLGELK